MRTPSVFKSALLCVAAATTAVLSSSHALAWTYSDTPFGYVRADGNNAVGISATDLAYNFSQHVFEVAEVNNQWVTTDLTSGLGAPAGKVLAAYKRSDGYDSIIAVGTGDKNGHIIEYFHSANGSRGWGDLTALSGAPNVLAGAALWAYVRTDNVNSIVFQDSNKAIGEIYLQNGWHYKNLTADSGAATPTSTVDPSGYKRSDGYNSVIYDNNGDIIELYLPNGGTKYSWGNLSAIARANGGCPSACGGAFGYVRADNTNSIIFEGDLARPWELALVGGQWRAYNLAAAAGGAPGQYSCTGFAGGAHSNPDSTNSIVYLANVAAGPDLHVTEIYSTTDGAWHYRDLSGSVQAPEPSLNAPITGLAGADGYAYAFWGDGAVNTIYHQNGSSSIGYAMIAH